MSSFYLLFPFRLVQLWIPRDQLDMKLIFPFTSIELGSHNGPNLTQPLCRIFFYIFKDFEELGPRAPWHKMYKFSFQGVTKSGLGLSYRLGA